MSAAVVMTGVGEWREYDHRHPRARELCEAGCRHRDLNDERRKGYDRVCLRCMTWTRDPETFRIQGPHGPLSRVAEAEDAERERKAAEWAAILAAAGVVPSAADDRYESGAVEAAADRAAVKFDSKSKRKGNQK